eukprot:scaffold540564_cov14-Prasinocladus_malaysianus.AAC.1
MAPEWADSDMKMSTVCYTRAWLGSALCWATAICLNKSNQASPQKLCMQNIVNHHRAEGDALKMTIYANI